MASKKIFIRQLIFAFTVPVLFFSCKSKTTSSQTNADSLKIVRAKAVPVIPAKPNGPRAPIINIIDTIAIKKTVLYVKDSAASFARISQKLAEIYGNKIPAFVKKNKLKIDGAPLAWYTTQKAPYYFEAGVTIYKKPAKLPKGFFVKNIGGDSAVIAHFFGPYTSTAVGYEALDDYIKSKKKKRSGLPYEIYVGDPFDKNGKPLDPYRVQTDIVQQYH